MPVVNPYAFTAAAAFILAMGAIVAAGVHWGLTVACATGAVIYAALTFTDLSRP